MVALMLCFLMIMLLAGRTILARMAMLPHFAFLVVIRQLYHTCGLTRFDELYGWVGAEVRIFLNRSHWLLDRHGYRCDNLMVDCVTFDRRKISMFVPPTA